MWNADDPENDHAALCKNPASLAVALNCGIGSSSLKALVNALDRRSLDAESDRLFLIAKSIAVRNAALDRYKVAVERQFDYQTQRSLNLPS